MAILISLLKQYSFCLGTRSGRLWKRPLRGAGDSVREGVTGDLVSNSSGVVVRVVGEGSCRLMCHPGLQGKVFLTLGAGSPTMSIGNSSDDTTV